MAGKANQVKAGGAYVELSLKYAKFTQGLQAAGKRLKSFGNSATAIAANIGAIGSTMTSIAKPIAAAVAGFAAFGDKFDKMSARTGASVEFLTRMAFAAQQSGTAIENIEPAFLKMQRRVAEAAQGLKSAQEPFQDLGLDAQRLIRLKPEQQFIAIAAALQGVLNPAKKAQIAMRLFEESGPRIFPMLEGFAELRKEADALAVTMRTKDAKAAAALTDAFGRITSTARALSNAFAAPLAEPLTNFANMLAKCTAGMIKWTERHKELIKNVGVGAMKIAAAGAALGVLSGFLMMAGKAATLAGGALAALATIAGSPFALVTAGAAAAAGAIYLEGQAIRENISLLEAFRNNINTLRDYGAAVMAPLRDAFVAVKELLMAGELEAAAGVAFAGIKVAALTAIAPIVDAYHAAAVYVLQAFDSLVNALSPVWVKIKDVAAEIMDIPRQMCISIVYGVKRVWSELVNGLAIAMAQITKYWHKLEAIVEKIKNPFDSNARAKIDEQATQKEQQDNATIAGLKEQAAQERAALIDAADNAINRPREATPAPGKSNLAGDYLQSGKAGWIKGAISDAWKDYQSQRQKAADILASRAAQTSEEAMPAVNAQMTRTPATEGTKGGAAGTAGSFSLAEVAANAYQTMVREKIDEAVDILKDIKRNTAEAGVLA